MKKKDHKPYKQQYIVGEMGPRPVDVYVGHRLRERRTLVGITQSGLGEAVGLTFQQIQKYERGLNRMGASRLYEFSRILGVSPGWFFEGYGEKLSLKDNSDFCRRETIEFVKSYQKCPENVRKKLRALILAASKN